MTITDNQRIPGLEETLPNQHLWPVCLKHLNVFQKLFDVLTDRNNVIKQDIQIKKKIKDKNVELD